MSADDEILARALRDFEWYAETFLKVLDKQTLRLIPLRLKRVQKRLVREVIRRLLEGEPVRMIILKARREGVSTALQALFFWLASLREHQVAVTLSHHDDTTGELHAISERFYQHLPTLLKPQRRRSLRSKVMEFANPTKNEAEARRNPGLQSVMRTTTAKNAGAGQGANLVHCSEVGLWEENAIDAKSTLDTLLQIVPEAPGTIVALESTARGVGGEFHRRWVQAERSAAAGLSDFVPFFIPWFEEETNVRAPEDLGDLDEREERLRDVYECSDEQIAWRRHMIRQNFGGDSDAFDQEYPESPEVAFLSSGRPYFDQAAVMRHLAEAEAVTPIATGELVEVDGQAVWKPRRKGRITVWEAPRRDEDYLIVCDPSEGSGGDPQAASVYKRSALVKVAAWHGYVDRDILGDEMFMLGKVYGGVSGEALIAIEMSGGWGSTPLFILKRRGYSRLYRTVTENRKRRKRETKMGWYTTEVSRPLALDAYAEVLRSDEITNPDAEALRECLTFTYSENGKPQAEQGCHDDRVMCDAVAVRLWQTESVRHGYSESAPEQRRPANRKTGY